MNTYAIKAGSTDVSVVIRIIDSADGTPETGVVYNTSGIDLEYRREGEASTDITEATLAALTTAHADGGFLHIGNGYYRLDLPDAAVASGSRGVLVHGTVTGMVVIGCYIQLVAYDPFDTVRLGLTALPNAAAEAAGGLYTRGTGAGQINQPANGAIDANAISAAGTAWNSGAIGAATLATDTITAAKIAADAIGASELAADAVTEIQSGLATSSALSSLQADVTTLLGRITSALFSGITSLAEWLGLLAGKQTGNSTARTELRATGAGSGTFDETTDSQEALRDRGDAAWTTATGFSTLDASGVRAAVGLASANLDTQLAALPTDSENATAVWGAGTRVLTAIDEDATTLDLDATIRAAVGMSAANLDTQLDAVPTATENADALLKRDWTSVTGEAARSVLNALRFLRNKWTLSGTTLSVKEEDDTTEAWTAEVSTTPGADPITGSDPA